MNPADLLDLENKFIFLKNCGKSLDEIQEMLPSVDKGLLTKWNDGFERAVETIKREKAPISISIVEKHQDGRYIYNISHKLNLNQLESIKLRMMSNKFTDNSGLEKKRIKYLDAFSKYFEDVELEYKIFDNKTGTLETTKCILQLNSNDPKINRLSEDAIKFYIKHFIQRDIIQNNLKLIDKESPIHFEIYEQILPYAIKQLAVKNFQGIQDLALEVLPVDAKWIFLTGENSFGKSTILQAISLALSGERMKDFEHENFAIEVKNLNGNKIINYWNSTNGDFFKYIACYGPSRLLLQTDRSQNEIDEKSSAIYNLFNPDGILLNIEFELFKWYYKKDERYGKVISIFKKLIPNIQDIVLNEKDDKIYYIEKDGLEKVTFNGLASGFRSLIALVGDMIIRLFKTQDSITNPTDLSGIVIIDELDLHWHPKWQHRLPTLLSEIFPKVQFIASTHSPMPLLGAPQNSVFIKVTRTLTEGIKAEKLDIDITNLLPNHILTSLLFDMDLEDIVSVANQDKSALHAEDSMAEIAENKSINERLKAFEDSNAAFPDDLFK
jgi:AAA domain, putative AbiEii toxin, Type IV TA system/Protein of unknown function (DUF2813)